MEYVLKRKKATTNSHLYRRELYFRRRQTDLLYRALKLRKYVKEVAKQKTLRASHSLALLLSLSLGKIMNCENVPCNRREILPSAW